MKFFILGVAFFLTILGSYTVHAAVSDSELEVQQNLLAQHFTAPDSQKKYIRFLYKNGEPYAAFSESETIRNQVGDARFGRGVRFPLHRMIPAKWSEGKNEAQIKAKLDEVASQDKDYALYCEFLKKFETEYSGVSEAAIRLTTEEIEKLLKNKKLRNTYESVAFFAPYLLQRAKQPEKALPLYFKLYFNDFHHYDGEYAESRIKEMLREEANKLYTQEVLLSSDATPEFTFIQKYRTRKPHLVIHCIKNMNDEKSEQHIPALFEALKSPDFGVQILAIKMLREHYKKELPQYANKVRALLKSTNYVHQALGTVLVSDALPPEESMNILARMYQSKVILIKTDAIQAIMMLPPEVGQEILKRAQ